MFLTIAYPEISKTDFDWIQKYREKNDSLYFDVVKPHFTLVFPIAYITKDDFISEIRKQLTDEKQFNFHLRSAVVNQDFSKEFFHEFLVPDEGFSNFIKLHDKLYADTLSKHQMFEIDFIPHIGIGNSKDVIVCKERIDKINGQDISIKGSITSVDIVEFKDNSVITLDKFDLN